MRILALILIFNASILCIGFLKLNEAYLYVGGLCLILAPITVWLIPSNPNIWCALIAASTYPSLAIFFGYSYAGYYMLGIFFIYCIAGIQTSMAVFSLSQSVISRCKG